MKTPKVRFMFLPGAGGSDHEISVFLSGLDLPIEIDFIAYPNWRRYLQQKLSAEILIEEFTDEVVKRVPHGPILILGWSLGGHFGYGVSLRLEQMGREVQLLCAIDSFVPPLSRAQVSVKQRLSSEFYQVLSKRRFFEFFRLVRGKSFRALLSSANMRLLALIWRVGRALPFSRTIQPDTKLEHELNVRFMLRMVDPWLASVDAKPATLQATTLLLRCAGSARDDSAWQKRCPNSSIREVPGDHRTLFSEENLSELRRAFTEESGIFEQPKCSP